MKPSDFLGIAGVAGLVVFAALLWWPAAIAVGSLGLLGMSWSLNRGGR